MPEEPEESRQNIIEELEKLRDKPVSYLDHSLLEIRKRVLENIKVAYQSVNEGNITEAEPSYTKARGEIGEYRNSYLDKPFLFDDDELPRIRKYLGTIDKAIHPEERERYDNIDRLLGLSDEEEI